MRSASVRPPARCWTRPSRAAVIVSRATPTCGSSCPPTTRSRTCRASRRPSSSSCPARRCSSSTTRRPTARASWPTRWPPTNPRVRVLHRTAKQGLGKAYIDGFQRALERRRGTHRPDGRRLVARSRSTCPRWSARSTASPATDLVIGSRYVKGGGVRNWGLMRKFVSRGGSIFARIVLGLTPHDLTGGFKAWRARDAGRAAVGRAPLGRLRVPDRDDVPGQRAAARASPRCRSSSSTAAGREQDVAPDHLRGARRRAPAALGRAARPRPRRARTESADGSTRPRTDRRRDRGVRVVIDARPMQEPERSPLTAEYLDHCCAPSPREPLAGESFVVVSRTLRDDPADELEEAGLPVAGARRIPPTTRVFRSAGLTLDSFLLRGAEIGAAPTSRRGRRRRRLPHGRRRRAARIAAADRGDAPRPGAVGAARDLRRERGGALRPPAAGARAPRRGAGHRLLARQRRDRAPPPAPATRSASRSCRSPWTSRSAPPGATSTLSADDARAARSAARYLASPAATTRARTCARCSRRWPRSRDRGARSRRVATGGDGAPMTSAAATAADDRLCPARRRDATSASWSSAGRSSATASAIWSRSSSRPTPRSARAIMAGAEAFVYPALSEATGAARARGAQPRRAGHLLARRRAARGGRQCRHRRRAARPEPPRRRARGNLGRRLAGRAAAPAGPPAGRIGRPARGRTWRAKRARSTPPQHDSRRGRQRRGGAQQTHQLALRQRE